MSGKVLWWPQCIYSQSVYFNAVLLLIWSERGGRQWSVRELPVVEICVLIMSDGKPGCADAKSCTYCTDAHFNIYFQTPDTHKHIMLHCGWKWRERVMLTTPLTYSLSQRPIHHCWWSKIAALLSQDWVSSLRVFLLFKPAGSHPLGYRSKTGWIQWWNVYWMLWHCLLHNLTCLLAAFRWICSCS